MRLILIAVLTSQAQLIIAVMMGPAAVHLQDTIICGAARIHTIAALWTVVFVL